MVLFLIHERMSDMEEEMIMNERVDGLLREIEAEYKKAVEEHKPLQEGLDKEVKKLVDEFDSKEETKRYEKMKALADYIALTINMPLEDGTKEKVIEELVKECKGNGDKC